MACEEPSEFAATAPRGGPDIVKIKGIAARHTWVCGTAAGMCTCVAATAPNIEPNACTASSCCFLHGANNDHCSCRLDTATVTCADAMSALAATERVEQCPR